MNRCEWRNREVESARYRSESSKADAWAVAATERRYQLRLYAGRRARGVACRWMLPMLRELSGQCVALLEVR